MSKDINITIDDSFFVPLLTLLFIALKLCKVIDWAWVWVLSPLWIVFAPVVLLFLLCVIILLIGKLFK